MQQTEITLNSKPRGFHIITDEILSAIPNLPQTGIFHLFIQHTSAALTINENADSTVREDFESIFNTLVPENQPFYKHTFEGPDDMPAHIKASLLGSSISIPITRGRLALGSWQGIYLCEFRNHASKRTIIATVNG